MFTSVVSLTVTKAVVFRWLRNFMRKWAFTRELFTCPFCFSYYVAILLLLGISHTVGAFNVLPAMLWIGSMVTYFCVIGIASIFSGIIFYLFSLMETD